MDKQIVDVSTLEDSNMDLENLSLDDVRENWFSINSATKELGFKYSQYTRRLLLEGKLEGVKVKESHYNKWYIDPRSIETYMESNRRTNDQRRYLFYIDQDEEDLVRETLNELGIDYKLELSYKGK